MKHLGCHLMNRISSFLKTVTRLGHVGLFPWQTTLVSGTTIAGSSGPVFFSRAKLSVRFLVLVPLLLFCFCAGCGSAPKPRIRIAVGPWLGYGAFYLARDLSFFEQQGVDVQLVSLQSMSDCRRAFERGQVDAMCCTTVETVLTQANLSTPCHIIRLIDSSKGGDVLLGKPELQARKDWKGVKAAFEPGCSDIYVLHLALQKRGIPIQDLQLVPMNQTEMLEAARKGLVDAFPSFPPGSGLVMRSTDWKVLFDSSETPDAVLDLLLVSDESYRQNKGAWRKLIGALEMAGDYKKQKPGKSLEMLSPYMGLKPDELKSLETGFVLMDSQGQAVFQKGPGSRLQKALDDTTESLHSFGFAPNPNTRKLSIDLNLEGKP